MESTTTIETVRIETANVKTARIGTDHVLQRGYVYLCTPADEDAVTGVEREDGEPICVGFHGNDMPPCGGAEFLCDWSNDGYLVISEHDYIGDLVAVDGWKLAPYLDGETGQTEDDGTWRVVFVKAFGEHEYLVAGTL